MEVAKLKIRCISRPHFDVDSFLEFLNEESESWKRTPKAKCADEIVEVAGRICYMSFSKKQSSKTNLEYIRNLIDQGHESVLEHVSWTFLMTGVSRSFTHQLVRHRVGFAFSQLSQQYHDETDAKIIAPPYLKKDPERFSHWKDSISQSFKTYRSLIKEAKNDHTYIYSSKKEKLRDIRSTARSVLPNAIETKMMVTANARAIRHFLSIRGSLEGDWEMRAVSTRLYEIVSQDAPALFQDFIVEIFADGSSKIVRKKIN